MSSYVLGEDAGKCSLMRRIKYWVVVTIAKTVTVVVIRVCLGVAHLTACSPCLAASMRVAAACTHPSQRRKPRRYTAVRGLACRHKQESDARKQKREAAKEREKVHEASTVKVCVWFCVCMWACVCVRHSACDMWHASS